MGDQAVKPIAVLAKLIKARREFEAEYLESHERNAAIDRAIRARVKHALRNAPPFNLTPVAAGVKLALFTRAFHVEPIAA